MCMHSGPGYTTISSSTSLSRHADCTEALDILQPSMSIDPLDGIQCPHKNGPKFLLFRQYWCVTHVLKRQSFQRNDLYIYSLLRISMHFLFHINFPSSMCIFLFFSLSLCMFQVQIIIPRILLDWPYDFHFTYEFFFFLLRCSLSFRNSLLQQTVNMVHKTNSSTKKKKDSISLLAWHAFEIPKRRTHLLISYSTS